jgi:hypothetical protein
MHAKMKGLELGFCEENARNAHRNSAPLARVCASTLFGSMSCHVASAGSPMTQMC